MQVALFFPPSIGFFRLAPVDPILHYDELDDPTGVTWEGGGWTPSCGTKYSTLKLLLVCVLPAERSTDVATTGPEAYVTTVRRNPQ